jgi:hypothetical protein
MKRLSQLRKDEFLKIALLNIEILKGRIYENGTLLYDGEFAVWDYEEWNNYILAADLDTIIIEYDKKVLTFVYYN